MRSSRFLAVLLLLVSACGGSSSAEPDPVAEPPGLGSGTTTPTTISVAVPAAAAQPLLGLVATEVADGFDRPSFVTAPWGDDRLFVIEQPGTIRVVRGGEVLADPFLDLTDRVGSGGLEQGLLGLAFHPAFPTDPRFFVSYTDGSGHSVVASYAVGPDSDRADPESRVLVLAIEQPASNHNGGMLEFGTDGYLYAGFGDGGGANDQFDNGRDPHTLLGTILRLDVDGDAPYAIPPDNPFVDGGGRGEVWAFGVRNPWRFDIDPLTGRMVVADVGQARWEEISVLDPGDGGADLGWSVLEGLECFVSEPCVSSGTVLPVVVYSHEQGCSITGGHTYRGQAIPELFGHYVYGDWCAGWVRSVRLDQEEPADHRDWSASIGDVGRISSFGQDGLGELYVVSTEGTVWRIDPVR